MKNRKRIMLLSAVFLCLTKLSLSQAVAIEVVGTDTFPKAIVYHGVPVSVFTDSQTTTLAQVVNNNRALESDNRLYRQKEVQLQNIIAQKNITIDTMQSKIDDAMMVVALLRQNEADLKLNLKDAASKYSALKTKSGLRIALTGVGCFLFGSGVGILATAIVFKKL